MSGARWVGTVAAAVVFFGSTSAFAGEPATANSLQLGLGFRYGLEMNDGDFNPWGPGLGVQAGYTLPNAVYVGGLFEYFFGDKQETLGIKVTGNIWQVMGEGGYDIGLGDTFVIRPKLGVGLANSSAEICGTGAPCQSSSSSDLAIAPGATFMLFVPHFKLSADVRYDLVFSDETQKALIFTVGFGF
jgi:hypothetical protein